ncbi:MAG TPA: ferritin-like domain-containing protein [Burkholderiaceae bacterium]
MIAPLDLNSLSVPLPHELRHAALHWLVESDVRLKIDGVMALAQAWPQGDMILATDAAILPMQQAIPGRPSLPVLVSPQTVKHRSMNTLEGRAALIHALAHIEFNAINLALDALWRFPDMPREYYVDWLQVAGEEALHFSLLAAHLQTLGFSYGDFTAHNGLWEMAEKTQDDILARIALVPRTLEARGLDVSPQMRAKLAQAGDIAAAEILDVILRDEIGHVKIGNHWYGWVCEARGLDPIATYKMLAAQYKAPQLRGPFNRDARLQAGFTELELDALAP